MFHEWPFPTSSFSSTCHLSVHNRTNGSKWASRNIRIRYYLCIPTPMFQDWLQFTSFLWKEDELWREDAPCYVFSCLLLTSRKGCNYSATYGVKNWELRRMNAEQKHAQLPSEIWLYLFRYCIKMLNKGYSSYKPVGTLLFHNDDYSIGNGDYNSFLHHVIIGCMRYI